MALTLNRRVWVLAERLYIHSHNKDEFRRSLRQLEIDYPGENYDTLKTTKGLYTFMSIDDYTFAEFMEFVPTYKHLPILQEIVFDQKIQQTTLDNWNYYGEYIRNWYPELIDLLKLAGIEIDTSAKQLKYPELELPSEKKQDFLPEGFGDFFLDYIRKEINECQRNKRSTA